MAVADYIRARREFLELCWEHAQQHLAITVALIVFAAYDSIAWALPLVEMPNISLRLPKLPLLWVVVIVLAGITLMVVEGGHRLRQEEFGQDHNLSLDGILRGTIGPPTYERPKISLCFTNKSKTVGAVGTVCVRAALRWRDEREGGRIRDVSPLTWIGSESTAIEIGAEERGELLLATQSTNAQWDFGVKGTVGAGADIAWIYEQPFEFEIRLVNAKNGRILKIDDPLTFRWEWREVAGHTSKPYIVSIEPPAWTLAAALPS